MRSGRTAWISLRRCARSVAKAHWIVALGVQIGATGAAFALTKEAAVENCRITVGKPIVMACMQASGGRAALEECRADRKSVV